jgi:hypothetical protein
MFKSSILALTAVFLSVALAEAGVGVTPKMVDSSSLMSVRENPLGLKQTSKFKGLLDPSRFSFQNRVGVSFTSGARGGLNQYYLNTITYKAANPLIIQAQVGIQHNLYGSTAIGPSGRGGNVKIVVPYLRALYRPKPNIQIEIQFSNTPSYYGYWGGYPY